MSSRIHNQLCNSVQLPSIFQKMASSQSAFVSFMLLSLFFPLIMANDNNTVQAMEKLVEVGVEGMVYCQSCQAYGSWSLAGAKAIAGAKVSVICKDHRNRVNFYKAFQTDEHGYFYATLKGYKMHNPYLDHPLQSCHVKLVSSPLEACNLLTNVNYGLNGSPLRYEDKRLVGTHYEAVVFATGPLAFRPAHCTPKSVP